MKYQTCFTAHHPSTEQPGALVGFEPRSESGLSTRDSQDPRTQAHVRNAEKSLVTLADFPVCALSVYYVNNYIP